jgi:hypothetical protein
VQIRLTLLPTAAGAIHWARTLLTRVKQTMAKLQVAEPDFAWCKLPVGQQVGLKIIVPCFPKHCCGHALRQHPASDACPVFGLRLPQPC